MQRSLFRRQEDDEMLCMPDGAPAGRLWLNELDDLVETSRYQLPDLCMQCLQAGMLTTLGIHMTWIISCFEL